MVQEEKGVRESQRPGVQDTDWNTSQFFVAFGSGLYRFLFFLSLDSRGRKRCKGLYGSKEPKKMHLKRERGRLKRLK